MSEADTSPDLATTIENEVSAPAETDSFEAEVSALDIVKSVLDFKADTVDTEAPAEIAPSDPVVDPERPGATTDVQPPEAEEADPTDEEVKGSLKPSMQRWIGRLKQQREDAVAQVKTYEADAGLWRQHTGYLTEIGVTPQENNLLYTVAAALKTRDYKTFMEIVKPHLDLASRAMGETLPPDLQTAVDDGRIDPEYARELTRTRSEAEVHAERARISADRMESANRHQHQTAISGALTTWEHSQAAIDPDFSLKAVHVQRAFKVLCVERGLPRDQQAALAYAREAKADVDQLFTSARPAVNPTRPTPSSASNKITAAVSEPQSIEDVVRLGLRQNR